ncbi:UDP-N-acetylmuramoyl-tripeptide--D-alanyl-D-alanine ligase [Halobacillus yeomjeoni]|uniref:UDP-N-acetylmuramoyl-tripeptide--D-alanyl-D-alanine ligase n=1 Tax=Halobacillus yeomjeoni TaxID=311194 RepID=A0A931MU24_9BACI|nr:UDP-N-acetylmuramoyl-tripeptide--D-alanyl-D-alanine ligase [Halobacillus yeomjeoni]MBH0229051.1 UDP-N-acetylmuramoyl-tripeptide--D-alanyl-D-alanine ligase [Halobacillus yeomjeoni]
MIFEVRELTNLFPDYRGAGNGSIPVQAIMTDTRKDVPESMFIPIIGESFDAHKFINVAIEQGAVAALWQKDHEVPDSVPADFPLFFVEDTTKGLQDLASFYLKKVDPLVVGVTGSNGKTTTKDMTASVLATAYRTHKTKGNYNNHIGLPLTILDMKPDTEAVVLEMGMDRAGEISVLSRLARPDYALITNIGESHIENFGSREGIAAAKMEIAEGLKTDGHLIIDGDEPLLEDAKKEFQSISCGFDGKPDYLISIEQLTEELSRFSVKGESYELPMAGKHNVKNAAYVIALAHKLGLSEKQIQQGFRQLEMSGMRFEKHEGVNGALVINDAYNASPTSMRAVIRVISDLSSKQEKILILGDMFELGEQSESLHASVAEAIDEKIDAVYTIGKDSEKISEAVASKSPQTKTHHFNEKKALGHHVRSLLTSDTVVLIKASRGMKLEELLEDLVK